VSSPASTRPTLDARVIQRDINAPFRAVLINPGAFGFVNVSIPCMVQDDNCNRALTGACPVDESGAHLKLTTVGTVFYDLLHPTEAVHQQISAAAQGAVGAAAPASATSAP
jgi:outer membrane lipase/esterase